MEINQELKSKIAKLAKEYNLSLIVLFGSQATGYVHKHSDVDIGYISNENIDFNKNYDISMKLAQIFRHKDIEFTNIYNISPSMKKQIADTGIPLYMEDHIIFDYFKIHALREYLDTKPLRMYRDSLVRDFIKTHA